MAATTAITPALLARLLDRLRHAEQYAEAARLCVEDARELLEVVRQEADDDE